MFQIETSRADRLVFLRMSGMFSVESARECAAAKEAAVHALGRPYDHHSTLVDIRDFRIQSQDVFAVFTSFVANTIHKSRKIAILGGEGSARMQFRRVAEREPMRDDMRFFADEGEARKWLSQSHSNSGLYLAISGRSVEAQL